MSYGEAKGGKDLIKRKALRDDKVRDPRVDVAIAASGQLAADVRLGGLATVVGQDVQDGSLENNGLSRTCKVIVISDKLRFGGCIKTLLNAGVESGTN